MSDLMTRDQFREAVFKRDHHKCVLCGAPAQDAHHILERKLWPDGGYHLDNGASVCEPCHLKCEQTIVSCDELREKCRIEKILLPPHLYPDQPYDKWGNPLLPNGRRTIGELMDDESVKKVLASAGIWPTQFETVIKYPRTYHLPWSESATEDDRTMPDTKWMVGMDTVVTVKMDGENTSMTRDRVYARSRDTESHWTRDWVRNLHGRIAHEIPEGWRLCGENLYAKHSIKYDKLKSYFYGFAIWDGLRCLSWDETVAYYEMLGIPTVSIVYRGRFDPEEIRSMWYLLHDRDDHEGYVVRPSAAFQMAEFRKLVGKYVRQNHVRTHGNWMNQSGERNSLVRP